VNVGGPFPAPADRELNKRLRTEHFVHLDANPDWAPSALRRWPRGVVRFHNRLSPRLPMTHPLGWIEGTTWADDRERERIDGLPDDEQGAARLLHERAVHFRVLRTTTAPGWADWKPEEEGEPAEAD
jgi:hypothetical protein